MPLSSNSSSKMSAIQIQICLLATAILIGKISAESDTGGQQQCRHLAKPCSSHGKLVCPSAANSPTNISCARILVVNDALKCEENGNISVLFSYCATFSEATELTEYGRCYPNSLELGSEVYKPLPESRLEWNKAMCARFERTGTLCGKCQNGSKTLAYSFDISCKRCTADGLQVWQYIAAAFLPLTVFYILVVLFNWNISSSRYHGFVLFSQVIASPVHLRVAYLYSNKNHGLFRSVQFVGTVTGMWNLDFFRLYLPGFCLPTNSLETVALDLIVGVYPLLLIFLTLAMSKLNFRPLFNMWKPVHSLINKNWSFRTSTVDSIATFLLLSNTKFLMVSFDLLAPVAVHQLDQYDHAKTSWRLLYNPSVVYFGHYHFPFAILSVLTTIVFVLLPTVLLLLYQLHLFQKCLRCLPYRTQIYLNTFVDLFQGCYKNGTAPGTRDCRWFSAIPFLLRILLLALYALTLDTSFLQYAGMVFALTALVTIVVDPFKPCSNLSSDYFTIFVLFLSCYSAMVMAFDVSRSYCLLVLTWVIIAIPFLYISFLTLSLIVSHRKFAGWKFHHLRW